MAPNMAQKRAAKANRRKAVVAEKRKLEVVPGSLAAQVLRAAQSPIQHCILAGDLSEVGMATVLLARGMNSSSFMIGGFLIDTSWLGVKDTFFHPSTAATLDDHLDGMAMTYPVVDVDPAYARKLLREVTAWAASNGVAPHRDFAVIEKLFGNVDAGVCGETFEFGRDGKPDKGAELRAVRELIATRLVEAAAGAAD